VPAARRHEWEGDDRRSQPVSAQPPDPVFDFSQVPRSLNLDQHFRTRETSNGNQRTRRKIIAEDLLSQLSKAVTIAGVGDEHSHRDHISQGAAGLLEGLTEPENTSRTCPSKSPASDLPDASAAPTCPASQTVLPPLVTTASCGTVPSDAPARPR
jgi:hypothetical protein